MYIHTYIYLCISLCVYIYIYIHTYSQACLRGIRRIDETPVSAKRTVILRTTYSKSLFGCPLTLSISDYGHAQVESGKLTCVIVSMCLCVPKIFPSF